MVLAGRAPTYVATYGTSSVLPSGEFAGNLQNDCETLTLLKPETAPGEETEIDKVRYESLPPWPASPNGTGPSLQLVDSRQDNSRVGNWTVSGGWQFYSATGKPGTILRLWLDTAGDVYIDDFQLVPGTVPGVGTNVIVNGDFELPFSNGWAFGGANFAVATNTDVSSVVAHSGTNSLHIAYTAPGGAGAHFFQNLSNIVANTDYTVSFWYLPSTSASNLSIYLASSFRPTVNVRPVMSTPGTANSVARILPEFPPLWLNEVQPENVGGIADNTGAREPWIELYNAGTNAVPLEGMFLSDRYADLSRWAFPAGASIAPGEFKVVFADGEPAQTTAGEWHASFRVTPAAGSVALAWTVEDAVEILDYLNYTNLPAGRSYGDFPDGQPFYRQEFVVATPGATNDNTAAPLVVFINEWMAVNNRTLLNTNNGNRYDDWFELYNPGNTSASLGGYYLTDNLSNRFEFVIPQGFVIPPRGFLLVWADSEPSLNNTNRPELHANFRLNQDGEQIGLFASDGSMIDGVTFEPQFADISQGRYLDGSPEVYFLAGPTPGTPNTIWANRYPVLAPIPDADISLGQTLGFTASADDPDAPPQTFSYSLDAGFPAGASVNPLSGLFSWTPTDAQAPSTNLVTLRVTDNGAPRLSAARTFQVVVRREFRVTGIANLGGGQLGITFLTTPGKTYRMEFKNNLDDPGWTPLTADVVASSTSLTVPVSYTSPAQRFYRIVQVD
jgi:hypothetical protein